MPAWNPQANDIFLDALEIAAPADRRAFIERACAGDTELQGQVVSLLEASQKAGSFLEIPPSAVAVQADATIDLPITEKPGTVIGPYKLLQKIGEGGFGVVYMADQTEPVKRRVALKIIKPGMDTRQVIARFEAERQALAMMDHPNIAKVLGAGTTESGRPYFVMELIKGIPITQYCDEKQLTPRQRLELFLPACQALQHAHQKGIIHRDIKPSNVMVAKYDDRPVPKVIDFGVVKAIEQHLTEKTMFTQYGQIVGTVDYMSPEQADLNQLDIDTRSDIYSLGVLLYELLTGETPFDRKRLRLAAFDELLRIIREEEPPKPSLRLSTSESLPSIATNRQIEPKKLSTLVRGELDWIVMKALEKDRTRRYETANGFANDIQRYLNDEAVVACPPSAAYRFKKFARRNKAAIVTGSLVAAALIAAIAGLTVSNIRIANERQHAESERDRAEVERQRADLERDRAEHNLTKAHETVREYYTIVSQSDALQLPALQPLRQELLENALRYYDEFLKQRTEDPQLQLEIAATHFRMAIIQMFLSRPDDGMDSLRSGLDLVDELRRTRPHFMTDSNLRTLGGFFPGFQSPQYDNGDPIDVVAAQKTLERPVETWHHAGFQDPQYDNVAAQKTLERAAETWEDFIVACPDDPDLRNDLASLNAGMGHLTVMVSRPDAADHYYTRAIELWEGLSADHPDVVSYRASLAHAFEHREDLPGSRTESLDVERALALREKIYSDAPDSPKLRANLGLSLQQMARKLLKRPGDYSQACDMARRAIRLVEPVVKEFPNVVVYRACLSRVRTALADALIARGRALVKSGKNEEAEAAFKEAEAVLKEELGDLEQLTTDFPENKDYPVWVNYRYIDLARCLHKLGKFAEAEQPFRDALDGFEQLTTVFPEEQWYRINLRDTLWELAQLLEATKRIPEAKETYRRALDVLQKAATDFPENPEHEQRRLRSLRMLTENLLRQGKTADLAQLVQEQPDLNRMLELEPENKGWFYTQLAIYHATGQPEKAEAELEQRLATAVNKDKVRQEYALKLHGLWMWDDAIVAHRKLGELGSTQSVRALGMRNLGCAYALKGDRDQAFEALNESIELGASRLEMFQDGPDLEDLRDDDRFGELLEKLQWIPFANAARKHAAKGELPEAIAQMSQAVGLNPNHWRPYYELALIQLSAGHIEDYRKTCSSLREVASQGKDLESASFVAWTSALAPDAVDDYVPLIKLAHGTVDASPENSQYLKTLGAILLRAGKTEAAIAKLTEVARPEASDKGPRNSSPAYTQYFLAMAHHAAGRAAQAGEHLQKANTWTDKVLSETEKPVAWNRRLTLQILRQEAEALITEPSADKQVATDVKDQQPEGGNNVKSDP